MVLQSLLDRQLARHIAHSYPLCKAMRGLTREAITRSLTEMENELKAVGVPLPPPGTYGKKELMELLAKYHWEKNHPGEPLPHFTSPMLINKLIDLPEEKQKEIWESPEWYAETKQNGLRIVGYFGATPRFNTRGVSVETYLPGDITSGLWWLKVPPGPFTDTEVDGEIISIKKQIDTSSYVSGGAGTKTNNVLQACLRGSMRILTNRGYFKIGFLHRNPKLVETLKVWTGKVYASFTVLNMGVKPLVRAEFCDGHILEADPEHKIKCLNHNGTKSSTIQISESFKALDQFKVYQKAALVGPKPFEFETPDLPLSCEEGKSWNFKPVVIQPDQKQEFYYWLGRYYGDGNGSSDEARPDITWHFGETEYDDVLRLGSFLSDLGLTFRHRFEARAWRVELVSRAYYEIMSSVGIDFSQKARTKRLPELLFQERLVYRRSFIQGVMDSDGYKLRQIVHLMNPDLLRDLFDLSEISGYRVKFWGPHADGSAQLLITELEGWSSSYRHDCYEHVGFRCLVPLGVDEEVYTLSVDDPEHQYQSAGLVSKNCVALLSIRESEAAQRGNGMPLRYVLYDIMRVKGQDVKKLAYKKRRELLTAFYAYMEPIIGNGYLKLNDSTNVNKRQFYLDIIQKGGEGAVMKWEKGVYKEGPTRTREQFKVKRQLEVDAAITGFTPPRKGSTFEVAGLIGGLTFSVRDITDGKWYEIGSVSNIPMEMRKEFSLQDESGRLKGLKPSVLNTVWEVEGQEWNRNLQISHLRIVRPRVGVDAKSIDEVTFDRQAILREVEKPDEAA